jgi:Eukaryotic translation initiation factor 4G1
MPDYDLPTQNDVSAPWFNENNPRELAGYFKELGYLFERHRVSDATRRKQSAVRYVSADVRELWQCAAAWDDPTRSYEAFKAEVHAFYPEATDTLRYTTWDLSALVNERAQCEMESVEDFGAFYRKFIVISTFLIKGDRLSTLEQARWFLGAFSGNQATRLQEFLGLKYPDVQMDSTPDIGNYIQAAQSVLRQQRDLALMTTETASEVPWHPGVRLGKAAKTAHVATTAALEIAPSTPSTISSHDTSSQLHAIPPNLHTNKTLACPSVLATARYIEDINYITYPEGIKCPKAELNINTQKGKFR